VRIAGVEVGKVKSVEAEEGTDAAVVVTSRSDDPGCRCTATRRPRSARASSSRATSSSTSSPARRRAPSPETGGTLKVTQTATPVQLDEVLTALQSDSREDLKDLLDGLAVALTSKPTAAEDRDSSPSARGETAPSRSTTPTTTSRRRALDRARCSRRSSAPSRAATSRG
jgi:ABC-type transporter Mla subunit MlaD